MAVLSKEIKEAKGSYSPFSYNKRYIVVNDSTEILPHMELYMDPSHQNARDVVQEIKEMNENSVFPSLLLQHQSGHLMVVNGAIAFDKTNQILFASTVYQADEEDVKVTDARSIASSTTKAKKVSLTKKKMPRISDIKSYLEDSKQYKSKETHDDDEEPKIKDYLESWNGKALKTLHKTLPFFS